MFHIHDTVRFVAIPERSWNWTVVPKLGVVYTVINPDNGNGGVILAKGSRDSISVHNHYLALHTEEVIAEEINKLDTLIVKPMHEQFIKLKFGDGNGSAR